MLQALFVRCLFQKTIPFFHHIVVFFQNPCISILLIHRIRDQDTRIARPSGAFPCRAVGRNATEVTLLTPDGIFYQLLDQWIAAASASFLITVPSMICCIAFVIFRLHPYLYRQVTFVACLLGFLYFYFLLFLIFRDLLNCIV